MTTPRYSILIPTYRRGEALAECLESLCALDYPLSSFEILIIDNGGADEHTKAFADPFMSRLPIRYLINPVNRGYPFSVNRGFQESVAPRIWFLNDDARPLPDFLTECDRLMGADPQIGCVGCRVIETGYVDSGDGIGRMLPTGQVIGNFHRDCGEPIEVDHVYGFCYVVTREAILRAGITDATLLAKHGSNDRIETDHCLAIGRSGLKVVFNPRMVARHLSKPRNDVREGSLMWKHNSIRNTIYLFLKHYGLFGKGAAALRLTFAVDVGLLSTLRHPNRENLRYLVNGLGARASAYSHYVKYLVTS